VRWERAILRQLIAPSERTIQSVEHKMDALYRGDAMSRSQLYAGGRQWGYYSVNDVRRMENLDPIPDGDVYLSPQNMAPADRLDDIIDKQVAPDPVPQPPAPAAEPEDDRTQVLIAEIRTSLDAAIETAMTAAADAAKYKAEMEAATEDNTELRVLFEQATQQAATANTDVHAQRALLLLATERADALEREKAAAEQAATVQTTELRQEVDHAKTEAETVKAYAEAEIARLKAEIEAADVRFVASDQTAVVVELRAALETAEAELIRAREAVDLERAQAAAKADQLKAEAETQATRAQQWEADHAIMRQTQVAAESVIAQLQTQLVEAEARQATALTAVDEARLAGEQQLAAIQAELETARAVTAEAEAAAREKAESEERAHVELAAATQRLLEQTAKAEQAAQILEAERKADAERLDAAEAAIRAKDEALAAVKQAVITHRQKQIPENRNVIEIAYAKVVRLERDRAMRNSGTPAKLRAWAEGFYLPHAHEAYAVETALPLMRQHLTFIDSEQDAEVYTRGIVQPDLRTAKAQILAVADGDPEEFNVSLERLLTRWERDRPAAVADAILLEEVTYVPSF
jgi:hypothetical protein